MCCIVSYTGIRYNRCGPSAAQAFDMNFIVVNSLTLSWSSGTTLLYFLPPLLLECSTTFWTYWFLCSPHLLLIYLSHFLINLATVHSYPYTCLTYTPKTARHRIGRSGLSGKQSIT